MYLYHIKLEHCGKKQGQNSERYSQEEQYSSHPSNHGRKNKQPVRAHREYKKAHPGS